MSEATDRTVTQQFEDRSPSAQLDRVLDTQTQHHGLANDLFAVVDLFGADPTLRRAVTDPAAPPEVRQQLVATLLDGKVSHQALHVAKEATGLRWPTAQAFVSGLERQAIRAALGHAQVAGQLDQVEDELFRLNRQVAAHPEMREALADARTPLAARQNLVTGLLSGKVSRITIELARRAVLARERTFTRTVDEYLAVASALRSRAMATVRVARPLSPEHHDRLQNVLNKQLGRPVTMHVVVDEEILGGVRVEVGDEVIDGTVASRLHEAHRLFS